MTDIIKKWLGTRLGIVLDMDPEHFGAHVSDGTLLARLLHSYDVINSHQVESIVQSNNPLVRLKNMKTLSAWLSLIGITCNEDAIRDISEGKGVVSMRLFYNIFLNLENKDILDFLRQQLKRETAGAIYSRFDVEGVPDEKLPESQYDEHFNELALPLVEKKHMIDWHRVKIEKNIAKCNINEKFLNFHGKAKPTVSLDDLVGKRLQEETKEHLEHDEAVDIQNEIDLFHKNNFIDPEGDEKFTYDELLKLQVKALEYDKIGAENSFYTKELMEKLKTRARKNAANRQFKLQMQNMLMDDVWNTLMQAQEIELDDLVIRKLLKQSQYEKQMATKLFQVRNEKKVMAQNRALVEKLLMEKREEEFAQTLERTCNEMERSRLMNQFLDEKTIELHKRLYEEKQTVEHENNEDVCAETVDALVDLAVKAAEYKNENDCIPRKLWDEWKVLFFHSQPIFDIVDGVENTLDEEFAREMEEIVQLELERQDVLNDHDIHEYLHLLGPWLLEELCPDIGLLEGDQIVLGYVVHKLLDIKYPLPSKLRPIELPPMAVAAMVVGINDPDVITAVEELISYREILVISLENAINYCLEQFRDEMSVVTDIDLTLIIKSNATVDDLKKKKEVKIEATKKGDKKAAKKASKKADKAAKKAAKNASKSKSGKNLKSSKSKKLKNDATTGDEVADVSINDKITQTPKHIPDDDPLLTPKAELGRRAFEVLTLGEQISDRDLVAMLAEYLKAQENMEGWVIFNYPLSYSQAQALEEVMGGRIMPGIIEEEPNLMEIIEEIEPRTYEDEENGLTRPLEELRTSKLVPNPHPKPVNDPFKTYFTAYINAKKADTPIGDSDDVEIIDENITLSPLEQMYMEEGINYAFYYRTFDFPTIKQLARLIIGDMQLPLKASVELFGEDLDDLEMKFGVTDAGKTGKGPQSKKKVKKELEKEVEAIEVVEEPIVEEPIEEDKKGKKGKKEKGGKKGKKDKGDKASGKEKGGGKKDKKGKGKKGKKSATTDDETEKSNMDDTTDTESPGKKAKGKGKKEGKSEKGKGKKGKNKGAVVVADEFLSKPGEDGWVYANLSQPEMIQHALATMWENLEEVYLGDFKQVFFLKRIHYSMIMPYCNYIKKKVIEFSMRPDRKQEYVFEFIAEFNEIDEELRTDVEIKSEIHCRVRELQHTLWNICDKRKVEAESERRTIIADNWVAEEMCYLTNIYMEAIQLESDRCVDTIQLLHDYYVTMLNKLPAETRLDKIQISRLDLNPGDSSLDVVTGSILELTHEKEGKKKKSKNNTRTSSRQTEVGASSHKNIRERAVMMKQAIDELLSDTESEKDIMTPFHHTVIEKIHVASNFIESLKHTSLGIIKKESDGISSKGGKGGKKEKGKGGKKGKTAKSSKSSKSGKTSKSGKSSASGAASQVDEEAIIREASKNLIQEWEAALLCEANRAQFRYQLLKARAMKDLSEILNTSQDTFFGLNDEINKRYEREVAAVNLLCKVICMAIEDETQIQHELVLEQDRFFVREDVRLYPDPPPPPPPTVEEKITNVDFTVAQLTLIMEKLSRAAPSGWLPERAFVYMLADMALCGSEEGEGRIVPKIWTDLVPSEIPIIVDKIFNDLEFVDWKDFLIHALNIGFPSEREILNLRNSFRKLDPESQEVVNHDDYFIVDFWYEQGITEDAQDNLRLFMAKEFLFSLFQIGDNTCNYTALLLYFCKDDDPKCGFAKALALATGKRAVITEEEFLLVQDEVMANLSLTSEEILQAAEETACTLLEEVLEEAIQQVAGFVIKEIFSEVEVINHDMEISGLAKETGNDGNADVSSDANRIVVDQEIDDTPAAPSPSEETINGVGLDNQKNSILSLSYTDDIQLSEYGEQLPFTLYVIFEVALNVLTVSLPWHDKLSTLKSDTTSLSSKLKAVFDELAPGQPSVLAYQLFQHQVIEDLLQTVNKFKTCQVNDIITEVINSRNEENLTKVFSKT